MIGNIINKTSCYQTDNSISCFIPGWNIKQVGLVVVEQKLDYHTGVFGIILNNSSIKTERLINPVYLGRNNSHDV